MLVEMSRLKTRTQVLTRRESMGLELTLMSSVYLWRRLTHRYPWRCSAGQRQNQPAQQQKVAR